MLNIDLCGDWAGNGRLETKVILWLKPPICVYSAIIIFIPFIGRANPLLQNILACIPRCIFFIWIMEKRALIDISLS